MLVEYCKYHFIRRKYLAQIFCKTDVKNMTCIIIGNTAECPFNYRDNWIIWIEAMSVTRKPAGEIHLQSGYADPAIRNSASTDNILNR